MTTNREKALEEALRGVNTATEEDGPCWCVGFGPSKPRGHHSGLCLAARRALALPASPDGCDPDCTTRKGGSLHTAECLQRRATPAAQPSAREAEERQVHNLKCWPAFFEKLLTGEKTFEVRKDDRGFRAGDLLWLHEWSNKDGYTGREMRRTVTYAMSGQPFGIMDGYVVLGLAAPAPAADALRETREEIARLREAAGNGCGVCHCSALAASQAENERLRFAMGAIIDAAVTPADQLTLLVEEGLVDRSGDPDKVLSRWHAWFDGYYRTLIEAAQAAARAEGETTAAPAPEDGHG